MMAWDNLIEMLYPGVHSVKYHLAMDNPIWSDVEAGLIETGTTEETHRIEIQISRLGYFLRMSIANAEEIDNQQYKVVFKQRVNVAFRAYGIAFLGDNRPPEKDAEFRA